MIVGTAGHIDHGKTSLVRALTGVDADRLKEEKARGITIDLGFAYMPAADGAVIGFVDVPGHERLIHNMLAGASGIDFALVVVAADDGVMPQTREHLAILDLLGVSRGLVALTKIDAADAERVAAARSGVANALLGTGLEEVPIVEVSSVTGLGVEAVRRHLLEAVRTTPVRPAASPFRLAVDRCFTLAGAGTVVTGTVLSGRVAPGDRLLASPSGLEVRVRDLRAQDRKAAQGGPGDRCALNLAGDGVSKDAFRRGDMILDPWLHAPTDRIDAKLRLLPSETRPLGQWTPVHLHHAASEVAARVVLLGDPLVPGGEGLAQLVLDRPVAAVAGDRFVIRDTSAQRTIGGGTFLDLRAPTRRRRTPERLGQLAALAEPDHAAALAALLARPPWQVDPDAFARDRGLSPEAFAGIAEDLGLVRIAGRGRAVALSRPAFERLESRLLATLAEFHAANPDVAGIGVERLRGGLDPRLPAPAFVALLQTLARDGAIALDGAWVRLAGHEVRLTPVDEELWEAIEPMLGGEARFRPPRVRDIAGLLDVPEEDIRRLLRLLARMGRLHEVAQDHFFLRDVVGEMVGIAVEIDAAHGLFSAAQFRDRLDNGRKVAILILEFLDRHGVTLRRGDLRRVNARRLDLFPRDAGPPPAPAPSGGESSPVGRPDFNSGWGRETVPGGFDSHSLPPLRRGTA